MNATPPDARAAGITDPRAGATGREIAQQPRVWREVAGIVAEMRDEIDAFLSPFLEKRGARVVLTGAGSSAYVGQLVRDEVARGTGVRVDAIATTDIVSNPRDAFAGDVPTLLVSFARSGDSPESVAATGLANALLGDVSHVVFTCNPEGALARSGATDPRTLVVPLPLVTNDRGFAMTSSFTSMALSSAIALRPGFDGRATADLVARGAERILRTRADDLAALAARGTSRFVYLGSGPLEALARESALKVLELTGGSTIAISESSLGFRHGPKSILTPDSVVVSFTSNDPYTRQYDRDIQEEISRAVPDGIVVIGSGDDAWSVPEVSGVSDAFAALSYLTAAQVLALNMSISAGVSPDNPSPSGAVNRVVQGVWIHPLPSV